MKIEEKNDPGKMIWYNRYKIHMVKMLQQTVVLRKVARRGVSLTTTTER